MNSANEEPLAPGLHRGLLAAAGALLLTCIPTVALAQGAEGEKASAQAAPPAKPEPNKQAGSAGAAAGEKPPSPPAAAEDASKTAAVAEKRETFVDRDGDGIQDGQEHRFRRRGASARGTENSLGGERRQTRYRGGDGRGGPGPGGNGPRN